MEDPDRLGVIEGTIVNVRLELTDTDDDPLLLGDPLTIDVYVTNNDTE